MTLGVWRTAMCKKNVSRQEKDQDNLDFGMFKTKAIQMIAPALAIAGCLGASIPSVAVAASYNNDYRACAGRLLSVGITAQAASQSCAKALRPRELSSCVLYIKKRTQISAADALSACSQSRRPEDLATCVVGISKNIQEAVNPAALKYCGRSLLPVRFAQCVVGLRSEINVAPTQVMDTCIDGSDSLSGVMPSSTPPNKSSTEFSPTFETKPMPVNPGSK
jgi:hypothetical protein